MTADPGRRHRRIWLRLLAVLAGLVVVVGALVGTAALLPVSEEVPAGTTVAGVAVGGLGRLQVRTAVTRSVQAAVDEPVRLLIGDAVVTARPSEVGVTLDRDATVETLLRGVPTNLLGQVRAGRGDRAGSPAASRVAPVLVVDRALARDWLGENLKPFEAEVRDASMTVPTPEPLLLDKGDTSFTAREAEATVVHDRTGISIDVEKATDALTAAVAAGRPEVRIAEKTTEPAVSTEAAEQVDQLIGTFTTEHPCCAPRVTNIHRIAELVDGSVIAPGATFSLNTAAGRRTRENGFVSAPAIADGELVDQFGGGVSQFSTTLFNAAWFAGLDIEKHQPHSKYISRYPPGREATLDYDTIDQVIRNDTDAPVLIRTATTGTSVTVALYGHTGDRTVTSTTGPRVPRVGGGFSITVQRAVTDAGEQAATDTLNWSYTGLD